MINERRQRILYVLTDYLSTGVAVVLYNIVRYYLIPSIHNFYPTAGAFLTLPTVLLEAVLFPLFMVIVYGVGGYYNNVFQKSRLQEFLNTASTALIGTVVMFLFIVANDLMPSRAFVLELLIPLYLILFLTVYIPRFIITGIASDKFDSGAWGFNTLIIGTSQAALNFEKRLRNTRHKTGLRIVGFVDTVGTHNPDGKYPLPVYPIDDIKEVCRTHHIQRLIIVPHRHGMRATTELISKLFPLDLPTYITPDVHQLITARPRMLNVASEPLVEITRCTMPDSTNNLKRLSDIVVSSLVLIAIAPIIGVLALLIKRSSPGPVFYKQTRIGLHKKPFSIYKLRSMTEDAEAAGPALSTIDDPRITPLGRFMRKYRLDELPQFWNVLKGDMSIVGPRPERDFYIRQIVERVPYYTLVHQVRPGITSWGMVKYGYASNVDEMVERLAYDLLYIENVSFVIDLKILIYTVRTVLTGKGI